MAGNSIRISTDKVRDVAASIEKLNQKLADELATSKTTIDNLANVWEGDAARATISAFDEFAAKYFQDYEDYIARYVQFLRVSISQGYFDSEKQNESLADAFK